MFMQQLLEQRRVHKPLEHLMGPEVVVIPAQDIVTKCSTASNVVNR